MNAACSTLLSIESLVPFAPFAPLRHSYAAAHRWRQIIPYARARPDEIGITCCAVCGRLEDRKPSGAMCGCMTNQERLLPDQADAALFKDALRAVVGSVSIVAAGQSAERRGLTVTAAISLCVEPPMVLACINRNAEAHDIILETGAFSWNILSVDHVQLAERFAALDGSKGASRFSPTEWGEMTTGSPVLLTSVCSFDCKVQGAIEQGTHTIIVATVVAQKYNKETIPLIYSYGQFGKFNILNDE